MPFLPQHNVSNQPLRNRWRFEKLGIWKELQDFRLNGLLQNDSLSQNSKKTSDSNESFVKEYDEDNCDDDDDNNNDDVIMIILTCSGRR